MAKSKEELRTCIRCGQTGKKADKYCMSCGAPLQNRCTFDGGLLGEPCGHINSDYASFCSKCGSYTAYYKAGLFQSAYGENKVLEMDEAQEMKLFGNPFFK